RIGPVVSGVKPGGTAGKNEPANSPRVPSRRQSAELSSRARVCALARPSTIQRRNCSAVTGPYSRPSAPMILYMRLILLVVFVHGAADIGTHAAFRAGDKFQQDLCRRAGKFRLRLRHRRAQVFAAAEQ